jgi:2-phospho-L-lactate/phosphoenolpyruvate guanylyltransferase
MRTAAILPVKRFARAKQRLGESISDPLRRELAEAMVADVLLALEQTSSIEQTILVTGERSVAMSARAQGAIVIEDDDEHGQPAAAKLGIQRALAEGIERVLCVPGDCPTLDPAELNALLQSDPHGSGKPGVVIVPDRHGAGTNGLLLTPPDALSPSFGANSCKRHRALALAAGLSCRVQRVSSLLLDIDTGDDLDVLRARLAAHPARAMRTRAVLGQPERTNTISITTPA